MFACFCFTGVSDAMHSGSGCHVWRVGPQRLAQGEHRGHPVDLRVAQDRAKRLQTDLGGECHTQLASVKYGVIQKVNAYLSSLTLILLMCRIG
jgi:hypothetical protein